MTGAGRNEEAGCQEKLARDPAWRTLMIGGSTALLFVKVHKLIGFSLLQSSA